MDILRGLGLDERRVRRDGVSIIKQYTEKEWDVDHGEMEFGMFENRGDRRIYEPYEFDFLGQSP
jgi:hypothetical protein